MSDLSAVSSARQPSQPPMYVSSMISSEVGRGYETPLLLATIALCYFSWPTISVSAEQRGIQALLSLTFMLMLRCRWGNRLSQKMFVGKDFVLKHIRVKHAEKVEEYKQQVQHQPSICHQLVAAQQILCCVLPSHTVSYLATWSGLRSSMLLSSCPIQCALHRLLC